MPKRQTRSAPFQQRAELVIKANCEHSSSSSEWLASGVHILGNAAGFQQLAECLVEFAKRGAEDVPYHANDPDQHEHLDVLPAVNRNLSDDFGVMIGVYSSRNRRRVFGQCGVSKASQVRGTPITHLLAHLEFIERAAGIDDHAAAAVCRDLPTLIERATGLLARLTARGAGHA
jgi:hypothetical protein